MPPFDLKKLHRLDQSSPDFPSHLMIIFDEKGYSNRVASIQDDDSVGLIEYLDSALNILTTSPAFWACLRELREICGRRKTIPQSCMLPGSPPVTPKWPIASRGYCDVYEGSRGDTKVCVKRLRIYSNDREETAKRAFCQEVVLWKHLEHPNIVPLIGATVDPLQALSIWMVGGDLSEYISAHPCADRLSLISDVADGLNYLHSHGVIHGDLKGPSILVDDTGRARLTDFGLAAVVLDFGSVGSIKDGHAMRWAAPEILDKERPVSKKSDVYSFAMVTIEAFTGRAPFDGIAPTTVAVGILAGKRPPRPTYQCLTNELWETIEGCWDQDPQRRPDISEVVLCLRTTSAFMRDRSQVNGFQAPDDTTTVESVREKKLSTGLHFQPSRWAPRILQRLRFWFWR